MKFSKLALRNVKKSYKDYFVYFITLMFSVCLFYTFDSFSSQEQVSNLSTSQSTVLKAIGQFMNVLSVFIAIVLAFLTLYANNLLIRKRKQEFRVYILLGMSKRDIPRILVYETMAVGFLSLLSGLLLGTLCSQLLGIFSAGALQVSMSLRVIFSIPSAITTSISFAVIFVIIMLLNARVIAKVELIDLLQSKKKMEKIRIRRPRISVLVLLISLTLLATVYYLAASSLQTFTVTLVPILVVDGVGTILFFMSLSGFLLQFIRFSKCTYYHNLHMVVLRQINAKISSASTSMGIVCLMLLLAIGALSRDFSLHRSLVDSMDQTTPYIYTYMQDENISGEAMKQLLNVQKAKRQNRVNVYTDRDTLRVILPLMEDYDTGKLYAGAPLEYISVSNYNKAMESQGNKPVSIHNKEAFFISAKENILDALTAIGDVHKTISVYGHKLKLVNAWETSSLLCTSPMPEVMLAVVVPDAIVQSKTPIRTYWNIDLAREAQVSTYQARVEKNIADYARQIGVQDYRYSEITRNKVRENSLGSGTLFVYIGSYLDIVLLISNAAVLALQQLSDADDSKSNYDILHKIGTPQRMIDRSILEQIAIYFILSLNSATVHAMVGVPMVSSAFSFLFGLQNMWKTNSMTTGIVLLVYGTHFLITYYGCRMAMQDPRHKQEKQ